MYSDVYILYVSSKQSFVVDEVDVKKNIDHFTAVFWNFSEDFSYLFFRDFCV